MKCLGKEAHFTQLLNNRNYYFIQIAYASNVVELNKKCRFLSSFFVGFSHVCLFWVMFFGLNLVIFLLYFEDSNDFEFLKF